MTGVVSSTDTNTALVVLWITTAVHSYALPILNSPDIQIKGKIDYSWPQQLGNLIVNKRNRIGVG